MIATRTMASERVGAYATVGGTLIMLIGAALWGTSGTDLWAALDGGDLAGYLVAAGGVRGQLVANLTVWIVGVLVLGVALTSLAEMPARRPFATRAARMCLRAAVPLVVVSYLAMLALVVQIAPDTSDTSLEITRVVGWIAVRADDLGTALILGATPLFISLAGQDEWVPSWLARWGLVCGVTGLISLTLLYFPGWVAYSFVILPVGMGWLLAAGIMLWRRG